jgi:hypothetical protein
MPQARVYNDNVHPYRENFKGSNIEIPPGGFVVMDYEEALQFEYTGAPMIKNAGGQQCPTSFKRIRVVPLGAVELADVPLVCHATGEKAHSPAELRKLEEQNAHLLHDEAKEQVQELKAKDEEIAALKAQLEALSAQPPKNKGGRPRKNPEAPQA